MEPAPIQFEWGEYGATVVHPTALVFLAVSAVILLMGGSRRVLVPFLLVGTFMTAAQRIAVGPFDFTMMRLLLIVWVARVVMRSDGQPFDWHKVDSRLVAYAVVGASLYVVLWANTAAVVFQLGRLFDIFLIYFLIRHSVRSQDQVLVFIRALACVMVLSASFMLVEHIAHYNLFSVFGGVRESVWIREGRLRAQGSFSHAIMAGTFGASFLPLFWALWSNKRPADRIIAAIGAFGAVAMTFAAASSGAVLTLMASVVGVLMWNFRHYVVRMKRAVIPLLFILHFLMEAPVWHLISRVDVVGGSTGYHRFRLIDAAVNNFSEWALIGVRGTRQWGWQMHDVTNHFIQVAVDGGLLSLVLFLLTIGAAFRIIGRLERIASSNPVFAKLWWAWGVVLFSHVVSFMGVSYFGQMNYFWFMTLAVIASLPQLHSTTNLEPIETPNSE